MKNKQAFMVLFVLALFFCNRALGAESVDSCRMCVLYKYNIATQDRSHKAVTDSVLGVLEIGDNICKYGDLTRYAKKKGTFPEAMGKQPVDVYDSRINAHTFVYQQYPEEGTMTVREFLHPSFFAYQEEALNNWSLEKGDTTVLGYKCKKARLAYGGREWTAWYAPDLPISGGPWKLYGLPGLVLKAEDASGTHRFIAYSLFKVNAQAITYDGDPSDKATSRDKFISFRNRIKLDERYIRTPYYHDAGSAQFMTHPREWSEEHNVGLYVSGVYYPVRYINDNSMEFTYNYFQPLETE